MSDIPDAPDSPRPSRPLRRRIREAIRGDGMREEASGRHAVRPVALSNMSDITLFASESDDIFRPPDDLEPWDPEDHEEVPWELRGDDDEG